MIGKVASCRAGAPTESFGWDRSGITFTATTSTASGIGYVTIDGAYRIDFPYALFPGSPTFAPTALSKTPLVGFGT